jgi:hypothetical protein
VHGRRTDRRKRSENPMSFAMNVSSHNQRTKHTLNQTTVVQCMAPMFHGKEINQRFLKGTNDETYRSVPIFSLQWRLCFPDLPVQFESLLASFDIFSLCSDITLCNNVHHPGMQLLKLVEVHMMMLPIWSDHSNRDMHVFRGSCL